MDFRPSDVKRHRVERYIILALLVESRQPWVPLKTLQMAMYRRGYSVTMEKLVFHLERVLEEDGLVELRRVADLSEELREFDRRAPGDVDAVKIARKGITALNDPKDCVEVDRP